MYLEARGTLTRKGNSDGVVTDCHALRAAGAEPSAFSAGCGAVVTDDTCMAAAEEPALQWGPARTAT